MNLLNIFRSVNVGAKPAVRPAGRSWLGVWLGRNRRRERSLLMVQGELALHQVKPVRNDLREDDVALVERRKARVVWESPAAAPRRDDQDLAWNRLRERRSNVVANE